MPTPFPGMDPYLERPGLWEEIHTRLIVAIADHLGPLLRPRYRVSIERRTYLTVQTPGLSDDLIGLPDLAVVAQQPGPASPAATLATAAPVPLVGQLPLPDEVKERYLYIRDVGSGDVVTAIELLSPTNKTTREGREAYQNKRLEILGSQTSLVEIDLIRAGQPFPVHLKGNGRLNSHYRLVVSRAWRRPLADVYLFNVRDPIPEFPVPLRAKESEPALPLNRLLHELYERAGYDMEINYQQPLVPPFDKADAEWIKELLQKWQPASNPPIPQSPPLF